MPDANARTRYRRRSMRFDKAEIVNRIKRFYEDDLSAHDVDRDLRMQRYAKLRMWSEGKDWPWEGASDMAMPDLMEKSLRTQDTLHNAVMSQRPTISAKALHKHDKDKESRIDDLLDYQFFTEQRGEDIVGELADAFVNDGVFTAYVPWIREWKESSNVQLFSSIPEGILPVEHFRRIIASQFDDFLAEESNNGWDWRLRELVKGTETLRPNGRDIKVQFYTRRDDQRVEMVMREQKEVYNGPRVLVKDYDAVLHPPRAANLQPPGPSNPGGAQHVILIDYPTVDEIKRLKKQGIYDEPSAEDMEAIEAAIRSGADEQEQEQRDVFAGVTDEPKRRDQARGHGTLTRLICFDLYDADGDGIDEDVIWWMILETKTLLRARRLTEVYPSHPPRRPFAETSFIPVRGRRKGVSLLELMESTHDASKVIYDQVVDYGTITNAPFFFYRPTSNINPDVIRLWPGEGYPLSDPQRDINFPNLSNQAQAHGLNMLALLGQMSDKVTVIGDLQLGRVPGGASSALRTSQNMQLLAGQGEARPERILRRFFVGLTEIWAQMHELDQQFLPRNKRYRILGMDRPGEDPFDMVEDVDAIRGRFKFTFAANVLNTSKAALQQSLDEVMGIFINPLMIQLGIVGPEQVFRLLRDFAKARGQDPDRYLIEPAPGAAGPFILAEDAVSMIVNGLEPHGMPAEPGGAVEHLEKLIEIINRARDPEDMDIMLTDVQLALLLRYAEQMQNAARQQLEQQQLLQAAQQFSQQAGAGQNQGGRPPTGPGQVPGTPMVNQNELIDESLPGAGGGANG